MAVIKSEDAKAGHKYIVEELDSQTCMVNADRLPELEAKVKEVSFGIEMFQTRRILNTDRSSRNICQTNKTIVTASRTAKHSKPEALLLQPISRSYYGHCILHSTP
jgi:hypothetical protein